MPCMGPGETPHDGVDALCNELIEYIRRRQGRSFLRVPEILGDKDHPDEHHSRALAEFHLGVKAILDQDAIEGF